MLLAPFQSDLWITGKQSRKTSTERKLLEKSSPFPEEISICGFTNGDRAKACDPMLTTVEQRGVAVGEEAANILIGQVEGSIPRDEVEKRVVRTRLVVRGTTR